MALKLVYEAETLNLLNITTCAKSTEKLSSGVK